MINSLDSICFGGTIINQVFEARYLGSFVDCNLHWKKHSEIISSKAARGLDLLRPFLNFFPVSVLKIFYGTIIQPYIVYGCALWASNFYANYRRIQTIQNKAVRLLGECDNLSGTFICYSNFEILNVGQLRDHQLLTLVYQCLNGVSPAFFVDIFSINSDYHSYHTRSVDKVRRKIQ